MGRTVWLEVALNGSWGRQLQPLIPMSEAELIAEGIACAGAGAAIIHLHTYRDSGEPRVDASQYERIIGAIRAQCDAIVYPTIDSDRAPGGALTVAGPHRYSEIERMATRGLIEWAPIDPGSTNFASYARLDRPGTGLVYLNPEPDIRTGLELCARHALTASYAIYEPGFLRLGAALTARTARIRTPIYRLMLSEGMTFGLPPREYALDAYRAMLAEYAPGAPWMIAGYLLDPLPLIPSVVATGGHVRVGLEDAPLGSKRTNLEWVELAAAAIRSAGGELANAREVRAALAPLAARA